jgi:DNA-binding transcriptional LysR family regulator
VLVAPAGTATTLADLDDARVLVSCDYERQLVEARLLADGIAPAGYSRFDDNGLIQALAAAGEGVAVVPRLTVDLDDPRIEVHDLPDLPPRQLVAMWHRDRHLGATTRAFLDAAGEVCRGWI